MLKNLFCLHNDIEVVCWHYVHPLYGYYTKIIEVQYRCMKCGRYYIKYATPEYFRIFENMYKDKYWSDICKPVLNY